MEEEKKPDMVSPEIKNKNIQTYVDDMTKVLESNKEGLIKKLIQEQERHDDEKKAASPISKRNKLYGVLGSVLILAAFAAVGSVLIVKKNKETVDIKPQFKPIIFLDESGFVEIGGLPKDRLVNTVINTINTSKITEGQVEGIYLTEDKKIIGLRRFLALIKSSFIPGDVIYVNDNFLFGVTDQGSKNPFFLLKVRSFADIFPLMRDWESKIFFDLHGFFGIEVTSDTKYLTVKDFEDGFVGNKNARILYDDSGEIVMMYVFADENSVIVTNKELSATEIMSRLTQGDVKK